MMNPESAALCYGELACLSQEKQQPLMRDRFLLLTAAAACRAGWAEIAADCHRWLTAFAPHHQATRFTTVADALRDPEFIKLVEHWERFCPKERAEMLLSELGALAVLSPDDLQAAERLQIRLQQTFDNSGRKS